MVEGFLGHDRLCVHEQETTSLGQDRAARGAGLSLGDRCVVRRVVRDELDHAEPLGDRQGADRGDDLFDGHRGRMPRPAAAGGRGVGAEIALKFGWIVRAGQHRG